MKKRQRKSPTPKKHRQTTAATKKKKATTTKTMPPGPGVVWTRPPGKGPLHPEIDRVLAKPFLATVYIDPVTRCFRFPVEGRDPHILGGLHVRMVQRYFRKKKMPLRQFSTGSLTMRKLPSTKQDGTRADRVLEKAIASGKPPTAEGIRGHSPYATAVWNYWKAHNHVPILSQLPVILVAANIATAGDYFTLHTDPETGKVTLWLWELKTGWPIVPTKKTREIMDAPLEHVWLTPWNRWQLQVLLTKLAYERELGMIIDGGARVIHTWRERPFGLETYETKIRVDEPDQLDPPNWTTYTDKDVLYDSLRKKK